MTSRYEDSPGGCRGCLRVRADPAETGHLRVFVDEQWMGFWRGLLQQTFDAGLRRVVLAVELVGVYAEENGDAVPGPFGYLGGWDAGGEPCGDARVPEVVGPAGEV